MRSYKQRFNIALQPVKVMLMNRRQEWSHDDWDAFVTSTKSSILAHPEQYLTGELPKRSTVTTLINMIFDDFLKSMNERKSINQ